MTVGWCRGVGDELDADRAADDFGDGGMDARAKFALEPGHVERIRRDDAYDAGARVIR